MRRSLTLISEGMLSRSTKKALTIASIGWLVGISPDSGGGNSNGSEEIKVERRESVLPHNISVDDANLISVFKIFLEWL